MNKLNFNSIRSIKTPCDWVDKALTVPKENPKPPFSVFLFSRRFMMAAGIVLVFSLGVGAYFLFGNLNDHALTPLAADESTISMAAGDRTHHPTVLPTQSQTNNRVGTVAETVPKEPLRSTGPAEPSQVLPSVQTPTAAPLHPSQKPTQKESSPSEHNPTQNETISDDPYEPFFPSEIGTEEPLPGEPTYTDVELSADIPDDVRASNTYLYCRIYNEDGELMGDGDLFSEGRRISGPFLTGTVTYRISQLDVYFEVDRFYFYYFYDEKGKDFAQGLFYIP